MVHQLAIIRARCRNSRSSDRTQEFPFERESFYLVACAPVTHIQIPLRIHRDLLGIFQPVVDDDLRLPQLFGALHLFRYSYFQKFFLTDDKQVSTAVREEPSRIRDGECADHPRKRDVNQQELVHFRQAYNKQTVISRQTPYAFQVRLWKFPGRIEHSRILAGSKAKIARAFRRLLLVVDEFVEPQFALESGGHISVDRRHTVTPHISGDFLRASPYPPDPQLSVQLMSIQI